MPNIMPKATVSVMGRLRRKYNSFRVMKKMVRRERKRDIQREVGWFEDEGRFQPYPLQELSTS
jgi:hypothetical protein